MSSVPYVQLEDLYDQTRCNLALLARLAQAEELVDRGCSDIELEHMTWRAIDRMVSDARRAVDVIYRALDQSDATGHTVTDAEKGGA
jgi:hypothetical protein